MRRCRRFWQGDIPRSESGNESGRAADEDRVGVEAVFAEHALLVGDPER